MIDGLGTRYEVVRTNIKKWSVGSPIQAPLDCVEAMLAKRNIDPDRIDRVALHLSDQEHSVVDNRHMPDICIQHMIAVMLLDGTVTFASSHDDARMDDPATRALRERIDLIGEPNRERRTTKVEIFLRDGTTLVETQDAVRGTPDNPMTRDEVETKAHDLMAPILGETTSRDLVTRIREIETVDNVRTLRPLLMA